MVDYIPEPTKKTAEGFKDHIMGIFKTDDYSKLKRVKTVCEGGEKQFEENN